MSLAGQALVDRSRMPDFLGRRESQLIHARQATLEALRELRKGYPQADPALEIVPPMPLDPERPMGGAGMDLAGFDIAVDKAPPGALPEAA